MGYYMGDPGFFSIIKSIGSAALGMVPGVGGVAGKLLSKVPIGVRSGAMKIGTSIIKHPGLSAAGGAAAVGVAGAAAAGRAGMFGRPAGKHPSKRHLHALAMGLTRARPRMNPCNIHALRRAARRAHAFLRISRRLVGHYQAKRPKGRAYIKHRRKAK
jgi:hypothetical protein